jgi:branched-chain amino acid transport system ATP-binding protein
VIEVVDLTVRFGGVTPLADMSLTMASGVSGLIGPNGAGKTTFFNVLSGFVRPTSGRVVAFGDDLLSMAHFRRVRWGLRRTFQTEQSIHDMTVYENVLLVHEHSGAPSSRRQADVLDTVDFVGLGDHLNQRVGALGVADRRLVEMARAIVGSPRVILLDEPAAGLPAEETAQLGSLIVRIPDHTGALTILVDHDMALVGATCAEVAVLDFGEVLAAGPTATVLSDPAVIAAYLGEEVA